MTHRLSLGKHCKALHCTGGNTGYTKVKMAKLECTLDNVEDTLTRLKLTLAKLE